MYKFSQMIVKSGEYRYDLSYVDKMHNDYKFCQLILCVCVQPSNAAALGRFGLARYVSFVGSDFVSLKKNVYDFSRLFKYIYQQYIH